MFKKYWRANIIFVFTASYFGIALFGKFILHKEIFPFYHWSLYSFVPQNAERVGLYLVEINEVKITEENLLSRKELLFVTPIEVNTVLQHYYGCYISNCDELTSKEKLLVSLLPEKSTIHIVIENRGKKKLLAIIKNQQINYVR